jgi:acyl dehydratase
MTTHEASSDRPIKIFRGADDVCAAVGTILGTSSWVAVAQDRVDLFADATGDHQWIHVDAARAAEGPFGATIAHGYLTLSMIPLFLAETYALEGFGSVLNYGLESVRFPFPVKVGSRVRGIVSLEDAQQVAAGLRIVLSVAVEVEGAAKPACVAKVIHLLV